MAREQFETDAADPTPPQRPGTPVARVVPVTPARAHAGGGTLLGHLVLGLGWSRAETD
ncbi:hypothetical protein [Nocardia sp. bgisy134]|uniref:hypothetical protein n=1 Tax=unclassified Nocardia TaxID=2637762 RepID=UPI003D70DABA